MARIGERRVAIIVMQLGGPDSLEAVEPFLRNLFSDPAILRVPSFLRGFLATFIARRRAPIARGIYEELGGASPILSQTEQQAAALEAALAGHSGVTARVIIAMRHWHPFAKEAVVLAKAFDPDDVILLPLYPQFSTTTTGSSLEQMKMELAAAGLPPNPRVVCCYPRNSGFIDANLGLIAHGLDEARQSSGEPIILFSAHGLPERIVKAGDPYQWQVEDTVAAILAGLPDPKPEAVICYQSRVGPLKWIGPSTEEEIEKAARTGRTILLCPVAFVSEHSETLVELDIEYRKMAMEMGAGAFIRLPTVQTMPGFISGLAETVKASLKSSQDGGCTNARICPARFSGCPNRSPSP